MTVLLLIIFSWKLYHSHILSKLCLGEYFLQCVYFCLYYFRILDLIDFIKYDYDLFHVELGNNDAFSCLSLNAFGDIDDKKHDIDDLCSAYDSSNEWCMSRAVNQSELQVFLLDLFVESGWNSSEKCRKAEIESDASLLWLWIFVETCCWCHLA